MTSGTVPFLESRYELGELLGEGSVGQVYAAFDTLLGIHVAVKIMRPELASSPTQVARFTREASVVARMMSPHVVKLLGLAVTREGAPCIVYEHLIGETLAMRLYRCGSLSLTETADIVKQTSLALARAHAVGVVHLDVKPENIFLTEQPGGRVLVKLIDFGIAELLDSSGRIASTGLVGTPEYIAPEVLFGKGKPDARADLYALGVVAFECLTGRCPFPGESIHDVIPLVRRGSRLSLRDVRPDLSAEVNAWMERALQPDPFWRYSSAKELASTLTVAIGGAAPAKPALPVQPARTELRLAA